MVRARDQREAGPVIPGRESTRRRSPGAACVEALEHASTHSERSATGLAPYRRLAPGATGAVEESRFLL